MNCEMCGRDAELFKTIVENSQINVCKSCAGYGKVIGRVSEYLPPKRAAAAFQQEELNESVVYNFGQILKQSREKLGLNHKEFASKIAEKESTLRKLETGDIVPQLDRARKLEKMLGVKLIEELREEPHVQQKSTGGMTLGDMIKMKRG